MNHYFKNDPFLNLTKDSICLCLTGDMDECVKVHLKSEWEDVKWTWFVQDNDDPYQTRLPGLMKEEWSTTNGAFITFVTEIFLCSYFYYIKKSFSFFYFRNYFFKHVYIFSIFILIQFVSEILHGVLSR